MNNLLSYCGLVDARIRASGKDLPGQASWRKKCLSYSVHYDPMVLCTTFIFTGSEKGKNSKFISMFLRTSRPKVKERKFGTDFIRECALKSSHFAVVCHFPIGNGSKLQNKKSSQLCPYGAAVRPVIYECAEVHL